MAGGPVTPVASKPMVHVVSAAKLLLPTVNVTTPGWVVWFAAAVKVVPAHPDGTFRPVPNTKPGSVLRVDMDSMKLSHRSTLRAGNDNPLAGVCGVFDREFLYVGTNTRPGRVIKVAKDTMQQTMALTLSAGEDTIASMQSDAVYLYVATYTKPGFVMQIRKSDMRVVGKLPLALGEDKITALAHGEDHLYAATDTMPGRLVRLEGFRYWPLKKPVPQPEVKASVVP